MLHSIFIIFFALAKPAPNCRFSLLLEVLFSQRFFFNISLELLLFLQMFVSSSIPLIRKSIQRVSVYKVCSKFHFFLNILVPFVCLCVFVCFVYIVNLSAIFVSSTFELKLLCSIFFEENKIVPANFSLFPLLVTPISFCLSFHNCSKVLKVTCLHFVLTITQNEQLEFVYGFKWFLKQSL